MSVFISKFGKYELQCRPQVVEQYATGMGRVVQEALYASFRPNEHNAAEREEAVKRFYFGGMPQNVDEATHVEPDYRIGRFDSMAAQQENGWSDDDRELVEEKLREAVRQQPDSLFEMPLVVVPAPWPAYHEFKGTPNQLAKKVREDGFDVHEVIAYEMAHENRDTVIAALGQLASEETITEDDLEVVG